MMRTIVITGFVLAAAIGIETKYQLITRFVYIPWVAAMCTVLLIILSILFVLVSLAKVSRKRELEVEARQFFVPYVRKPAPGEQDFQILLNIAANEQLNESEVFTFGPNEKNKSKISKWYSLLRDRCKQVRKISHG